MPAAPSVVEQRDRLRVENRRLALEKDELVVRNDQLVTRNSALVTMNDDLVTRTSALDHQVQELDKKIALYEEEITWHRSRRFGRSSEQLSAAEQQQIRLFNEIERNADCDLPVDLVRDAPPAEPTAAPAPSARRPRRQPLPQALPRIERVVDLPEPDKQCACGHRMVRIGEETAEKLDVIPPQVRVLRTVRPKYACHHCEGSGDEERPAVRVAPAPAALIRKGVASEGLLAFIATAKFCDALPLYRQEQQFARLGVAVSRRTMADWMLAAAGACRPLLAALDDQLRSGPILQIDETTVQVLNEPGRANPTRSYVWVARGGPPAAPVVMYRYEPSRAARVAAAIIGDYQGYVQTDGYDGYVRLCSQPGIRHVGCWAHVRRAFKEAAEALGKVSSRAGAALAALGYIAKLYRVETQLAPYRTEDPERFMAERRARVEPVLGRLHEWLRDKREQVLPSSALGKAVGFALGQWPKLIGYVEHAQLTPDNNACEQAIRPFVLGRKNWLFAGSPRGAAASAALYSLIETAKANRREPYWYLRESFEQLPHARTRADLLALLPTARPPPSAS